MIKPNLFILGGLSLSFLGCKNTGNQSNTEAKKHFLRYPLIDEPTALDPHVITDGDTHDLLENCFNTLVALNEKNEIVPQLAESFTPENGGKTYVFKLKKGIKFHNGKEMDADDVVWSFNRATSPDLKSPSAPNYLADIIGVKERTSGEKAPLKGVRKIDNYTIAIDLLGPRSYFLGKICFPCASIMPKDGVPLTRILSPEKCIGTGPFQLKEYNRGSEVVLVANPNYFEGAPALKGIVRKIVKDPRMRLDIYKKGGFDYITLERQDVLTMQEDPKYKDHLVYLDRPSLYYYGMNTTQHPAFKDRNVRRALAMAVDRDYITRELLKGINRRADSLLPPGIPGHREKANIIEFNPVEAKKLLETTEWGPHKKPFNLQIAYRVGRDDIRIVAESISSQLKTNLGIEVKQTPYEWSVFLQKWSSKQLQMMHLRWANDYLDPENTISLFFTIDGPENKMCYKNTKVDTLCKKADSLIDMNERVKIYQEAEDIILQDASLIPIYFQKDVMLVNPAVKGIRESALHTLAHTKTSLN